MNYKAAQDGRCDGRLSRILELSLLHEEASICAQEKLGTTDFLTGRQSALPPVPHPLFCPPCCLFQHCLISTLAPSSVTPPFCPPLCSFSCLAAPPSTSCVHHPPSAWVQIIFTCLILSTNSSTFSSHVVISNLVHPARCQ